MAIKRTPVSVCVLHTLLLAPSILSALYLSDPPHQTSENVEPLLDGMYLGLLALNSALPGLLPCGEPLAVAHTLPPLLPSYTPLPSPPVQPPPARLLLDRPTLPAMLPELLLLLDQPRPASPLLLTLLDRPPVLSIASACLLGSLMSISSAAAASKLMSCSNIITSFSGE